MTLSGLHLEETLEALLTLSVQLEQGLMLALVNAGEGLDEASKK